MPKFSFKPLLKPASALISLYELCFKRYYFISYVLSVAPPPGTDVFLGSYLLKSTITDKSPIDWLIFTQANFHTPSNQVQVRILSFTRISRKFYYRYKNGYDRYHA